MIYAAVAENFYHIKYTPLNILRIVKISFYFSASYRFLPDAPAMPMASLYFATVRRQICALRGQALRQLPITEGFCFFLRINDGTQAVLDAVRRNIFPPLPLLPLPWKGICREHTTFTANIFPLTARLTVDSWISSCSAISADAKAQAAPAALKNPSAFHDGYHLL